MSQKKIKIEKPKIIIGEGKEEEIIFDKLIDFLSIDDIQVFKYNGKDNLKNFLKTLPLIPGFSELRSLGITRDADQSFDAASDSINSSLSNNKLNEVNNLQIKTFILPDNRSPGMLEDLILQSIDSDEISCIDHFLDCIKNKTERVPKNQSKAQMNAWLSTQSESGKRLGEAAKADYINWYHDAFEDIKLFIKSL